MRADVQLVPHGLPQSFQTQQQIHTSSTNLEKHGWNNFNYVCIVPLHKRALQSYFLIFYLSLILFLDLSLILLWIAFHVFFYWYIFCSVFVVFKKELEKDIAGDTSGDFAKLLLALVQVPSEPAPARDQRFCLSVLHEGTGERWLCNFCFHLQTKRDEPSNVVDYEKIDNDARVSQNRLV